MWRTFCPLLLMLFTFDFPRDRLAAAEPVRASIELVTRDDDLSHRKEIRGRAEGRDENSAELVGKWRNNGEALEPKWRDGDTVPLVPFSQFSRYSRDKIDGSEEENDHDRRGVKYRKNNGRENSLRSRNNPRASYSDYEDYESAENRRYREREEVLPRKRNRPWISENVSKESGNKKEERNRDIKEDKSTTTSMRYREAFQARPNEYEQEFNDDEYLKPRPRKRRPPQNYEFALAENETLNEGRTDNYGPWSRANDQENSQESRNGQSLQNAIELKSLLKMQQEEGLSLSEVLQQRNLTLNDLLKGKADAINALRMKDVDETEDYIEETAKMMSNSFAKISTTRKPQWTVVTESVKTNEAQQGEERVVSIVPLNSGLRKNHTNAWGSSVRVNSEMYAEAGNATTGKSIPTSVDLLRGKVAVTTPVPLPVATNSMELFQADDATVKSLIGGEIKAESLDEDEIMEFSDFTDYKKGRNGVSPVWLMMKDGDADVSTVENSRDRSRDRSKDPSEDKGSTLSIEKILRPTERSKSGNNLSVSSEIVELRVGSTTEVNRGKTFKYDQPVTVRHSDDYSTSEEYQNDAPIYYDLEHGTQINSSTDESDVSKTIMQEIESALDAMSRDVNFTIENYQTFSRNSPVEKNGNGTLKNHQDTNTTEKKSYDDVISEVEPEARAEIFELFASGSAGKRLERLLKSRNMSLEELIALRQRGSSKVHLAEVSRIRAQKSNNEYRMKDTSHFKPTTSSEDDFSEGRAIANYEQNYGQSYDRGVNNHLAQSTENVKSSDSNLMNPVYPEESTTGQTLPDLEPMVSNEDAELDDLSKMDDERKGIKERHRTEQIVDLLTTFGSLPFAKDIQRNFAGQYDNEGKVRLLAENNNLSAVFSNDNAETMRVNDTSNVIESGFVKEVVKQEPCSVDIKTVYSETNSILGDDDNRSEKGKTLSKVKPSIIASGAILGVTLIVFLAIFIICRIRQKQKYRYRNTFSRAVFQGPVMAARKLSNSSSLSTVMVNVVATSTTKRPERNETQKPVEEMDSKSDIDNDSLDANDSWETIPDYMK